MKFWFSASILIIGFACFEADNWSLNRKFKRNVYSTEFSENPSENELDTDTSFDSSYGSGDNSDSNEDYSTELGNCGRSGSRFTDCPPSQPIVCNASYPYRTMNGSCNNLENPLWGAANQCFLRHVPAVYSGSNGSRLSSTGAPLVNARVASVNILQTHDLPTKDLSFMFTIYGQFVAHDISLSEFEFPANGGLCCAPENANSPACMTIAVSPNDPFYSQFNLTCLDFFRTFTCNACNTNKSQQLTAQTAAMDASIVYGPDDTTASELRTNDGTGKLLSNYTKTGEFLPSGNRPGDVFCPMLKQYECFIAGDPRVNQHVGLTGVQTLGMRKHNSNADKLKILNPHWDDERLYQEARRITIAELQNINFEYVAILLGHWYTSKFDLYVRRGFGGTKYNPSVRLGVWNEFATGPFRLHSMVATNVGALNLEFRNLYSNPALVWQGQMDRILNGVCKVPSDKYDKFFVTDVSDHLFQLTPQFGSDLPALDIQRGRDHGLAPYICYINYCSDGEINIQSFDDLVIYGIISQEDVATLKKYYATVEDIDFYVGIQLEYHSKGANVGPTAACIIAKQFYQLKYGDRFYFEHVGEAGSFTPAQMESIKKTSLSRLLCDTTDISKIQRNSFILPSKSNPTVPCYTIPGVDLSLWKDRKIGR